MADFTKSKPRFLWDDLFFVSIDLYNSKGCCFCFKYLQTCSRNWQALFGIKA